MSGIETFWFLSKFEFPLFLSFHDVAFSSISVDSECIEKYKIKKKKDHSLFDSNSQRREFNDKAV